MNFLDLLNIFPASTSDDRSRSYNADDLTRLLAQLRPADATTQMTSNALAQLSARAISLLASLAATLPSPVLFVLAVVASLSLIKLVNRAISIFTRLLFRLLFWGFVIGMGALFYERGVEGSVVIVREACGYALGLGQFFWREWERYENQRDKGGKPGANMRF